MPATDFGLIGHPLQHSLSPFIHEALLAAAGLEGAYRLIDLAPDDLAAAVPGLLNNLAGFNCTIPHKQAIIPFLNALDPLAAQIGAVNTIKGRRGYNTDLAAFQAECKGLAGSRVLILGAGGVSRTLAFAAAAAGAAVWILARRTGQACALRDDLLQRFPGNPVGCPGSLEDFLADMSAQDQDSRPWGLLNGTPLGMWPHTAGLPVPPDCLERFRFVYDTVYNPPATRLVLAARSRGIAASSGLGMLFGQALAAQRIWHPDAVFPEAATAAIRRRLARAILEQSPLTLVLNGFMGSGKTRVGQALAARLGLPFADLDQQIERASGLPVPEIFAGQGEAAFRSLERQQLGLVLAAGRSQVLSTGGGTLIDPAAEALVRAAPALVVFLDTPLEMIRARVGSGEGRPMIDQQGEERLVDLYAQRLPRYRELADLRIDGRGEPEQLAVRIAGHLELEGETR
jgi:shikimate dehydrogenase